MSTPAPAPFNVFIDSDGVVADFNHDLERSGLTADVFKHQPGAYLWLPTVPGAIVAIGTLKELDDRDLLRTWILTKTPSGSPYAYTEKILWYRRNFPWLEDRVILTHDKSLMGTSTDFLLDDRPHKANANKFRGTFVYFDPNIPATAWNNFVQQVMDRVRLTRSQ